MKMQRYIVGLTLALTLVACGAPKRTLEGNRVPVARPYSTYNQYIDRYAAVALRSQKKYKIPASIVLAQGLLESGAGSSRLAREANNHFGIKCHGSWRGSRTYHNDDAPNECFRAYNDPEESFRDHGEFLQQKRYSALFRLDPTDYKGWARGLQKAGYATDRGYANKLIKIIEDNRLYLIDRNNPGRHYTYAAVESPKRYPPPTEQRDKPTPSGVHEVYRSSDLLYVLAQPGDDLRSIAREMGISERKLTRYNDFPEGYPLEAGDVVYLQYKNNQAKPPYYEHVVTVGESIHDIAQKYGIRLAALYRINGLTDDYEPTEGDVLLLR